MKFGILGDLHLTNRGPRRRLDNYFQTQLGKLKQAFDIFKAEECDAIIQVGDFVESPNVSREVDIEIITFLLAQHFDIYCCFGQHDIAGHSASTLKRSPLRVLESANLVKILSKHPTELKNTSIPTNDNNRYMMLYAASFGEPIPETHSDDPYNILVTHRMIGDRQLYPDQKLIGPQKFLKDNPTYSLILCGDYHYRFHDTYNGRTIINPGCLMRKTISKYDQQHEPGVVTFDTNTNCVNVIKLNVQKIEEVFDLSTAAKKDNEQLLKFIENLNETGKAKSSDWKHNLVTALEKAKASSEVKRLIDNALMCVERN